MIKHSKRTLYLAFGILAVLLAGCENPLVQDVLRGPATLSSITVMADVTGTRNWGLSPGLTYGTFEYTAIVPVDTTGITVVGTPKRGGEIWYSQDGNPEQGNGVFSFSGQTTVIKIRVTTPYKDDSYYTINFIRGAPYLLTLAAGHGTIQSEALLDEADDYILSARLCPVLSFRSRLPPTLATTQKGSASTG